MVIGKIQNKISPSSMFINDKFININIINNFVHRYIEHNNTRMNQMNYSNFSFCGANEYILR